jgi:hypothetical protein
VEDRTRERETARSKNIRAVSSVQKSVLFVPCLDAVQNLNGSDSIFLCITADGCNQIDGRKGIGRRS